MTVEEKKERNRSKSAAQKARKAANKKTTGSDAEAPPPPAAHPQKRDAKPARKVQANDSIPQLCWYFQAFWNGGQVCTDYTDPKRGCKYTHRQCYTAIEFRSLTLPPDVTARMKT